MCSGLGGLRINIVQTTLEGVIVFEPKVFGDARGFFLETCSPAHEQALGGVRFAQDNHSRSARGVLRGLHYRVARPQGQLITLLRGECFDVVVDLRPGAETFGRWTSAHLSEDGPRQIYHPPGFAHGFYALSEYCDLHYKVTEVYDGSDEHSVRWDDPEIGVVWPLALGSAPVISEKDRAAPLLRELDPERLPRL